MSCILRIRYTPAISQKNLSAVFHTCLPDLAPGQSHKNRASDQSSPRAGAGWTCLQTPPNSRGLTWFFTFPSRRFLCIPRQSVPCFTIPAARNYPQISSLILPSCKYQPIVNNSYRELNNVFSLLQCLFFVITSPSQNKNDAPHSPLFNAKESKLLHPFIEGVIC